MLRASLANTISRNFDMTGDDYLVFSFKTQLLRDRSQIIFKSMSPRVDYTFKSYKTYTSFK